MALGVNIRKISLLGVQAKGSRHKGNSLLLIAIGQVRTSLTEWPSFASCSLGLKVANHYLSLHQASKKA